MNSSAASLRFTHGEVVHYDSKTTVATAVENETNRLFKFHRTDFYSGWPVRAPLRGDKISIRRGKDNGEFLSARLLGPEGE